MVRLISVFVVPLGFFLLGLPTSPLAAQPFAYITNNGDDTVSVIDTATNSVTVTVTVGDGPFGVAVTPDGTLEETVNVQLEGNAHDPRFLNQIFDATTVTGGRVDIESSELIFGTAVTLVDGQISTLPMQPAWVEYDFRSEADGGAVTTGKVTLWAEGNFVKGYLEAREQNGVPFDNPEAMPIGGDLNNGLLRVVFPLEGAVVGLAEVGFSFDQEVVQTTVVIVLFGDLEATTGTFRLTRVVVP